MQLLFWLEQTSSQERLFALQELLLRSGLETREIELCQTRSPEQAHLVYGSSSGGETSALRFPDRRLFEEHASWLEQTKALLVALQAARISNWQHVYETLFPAEETLVEYDLPACCYGLLQRWEEGLSNQRDEHGRWPASESLLTKTGFLEVPIVDWIARSLGEALHRRFQFPLRKTPWRRGALSWDVDSSGFWGFPQAAGKVKRAVTANRKLILPLAQSGFKTLQNPRLDPDRPFALIARQLSRLNAHSTIFVQTHKAHKTDDYDLSRSPRLVRQIRDFALCGHEVALHSSYATPENSASFSQQQSDRLMQQFGCKPIGHRAHYLRHSVPKNDVERWFAYDYDATLGFSKRIGFRLGTAWPVTLRNGEKSVLEFPLHAMDVTLRYHQFSDQQTAQQAVQRLIDSTKQTGGVFSLLWHPHNLNPLNEWPGWENAPFDLVKNSTIENWVSLNEAKTEFQNDFKGFDLTSD